MMTSMTSLGVPEKQTTRLAAAFSVGGGRQEGGHSSFAECLAAARAVDVSPEALAAAEAKAKAEKAKAAGSDVDPMVAAKEAANAIVACAKSAAAAAANAIAKEQKAAAAKAAAAKRAAKAKANNGGKTPPLKRKKEESDWVAEAMQGLDKMLNPQAVSARVTLAGFHAADDVVYKPEGGGWLVLAGDAACGRPFYLGSTLNGHFHDLVPLARGPSWARWDAEEASPFKKYVERIKLRTSAPGFKLPGDGGGGGGRSSAAAGESGRK